MSKLGAEYKSLAPSQSWASKRFVEDIAGVCRRRLPRDVRRKTTSLTSSTDIDQKFWCGPSQRPDRNSGQTFSLGQSTEGARYTIWHLRRVHSPHRQRPEKEIDCSCEDSRNKSDIRKIGPRCQELIRRTPISDLNIWVSLFTVMKSCVCLCVCVENYTFELDFSFLDTS